MTPERMRYRAARLSTRRAVYLVVSAVLVCDVLLALVISLACRGGGKCKQLFTCDVLLALVISLAAGR